MSALLLTALAKFWPYLVAILAAGFAALKLRQSGANAERAKQAGRDKKAVEERLEMDREATAAEREATALSDEGARKEAMRWVKPR